MLALKTTFSMSIIILLVSTSFIKSVQSEDTLEDHHKLQIINIVGGTGASLYCPKLPNSDDEFEICEIEHISEHRYCSFEQKFIDGHAIVPTINCNPTTDTNRFSFEFDSINCALHLKKVIYEDSVDNDSGTWTCRLKTIHGKIIHGEMDLLIIKNFYNQVGPIYVHPITDTDSGDNLIVSNEPNVQCPIVNNYPQAKAQ